MPRAALLLAALAAGLAGPDRAGADTAPPAAGAAPRPVISDIVHPDSALQRSFTGTVVARTQIALGFQTLGRIAGRHVDVGDAVRRGEVLARLDPFALDEDVVAAEAALAIAEAQRLTAANALDRARSLESRGVASTERLEGAERALAAAQAAVDGAAADLARARDARRFAELAAPMDGVIVSTEAEAGSVVSAGTPVMVLAGTGRNEAVIDLPEAYLAVLRPGDRFEVALRGGSTPPVTGTLRLVEPVADTASRTRRVHLDLAGAPPAYRIGSLVRARPLGLDRVRLFTLPETALAPDGRVWRVDPVTRAVEPVAVTVDPQRAAGRLVVTAGLRDGDEIVTRGAASLSPGQVVGARVPE